MNLLKLRAETTTAKNGLLSQLKNKKLMLSRPDLKSSLSLVLCILIITFISYFVIYFCC